MSGHGDPIIFQISGYSNSGKTTFITKLVRQLSKEQFKVVTLKHHGHGGRPDLLNEKDSSEHIYAGALASVVEGEGRILLQAEQAVWTLQEQIRLLSFFDPDMIIIEGHKRADFPKAVIVRDQNDVELLTNLTNIIVVFYWDHSLLASIKTDLPCFHINDENGLFWLKNFLMSGFK